MADAIIPKIGFFCKNCGQFVALVGTEHKDQIHDADGWDIGASYICPSCHHEAKYLSTEATLESEHDRRRFGLSH